MVVLAARKGVIALHEAFGKLRPDNDSPLLRPDSVFPMASVSKVITATAAMILAEDGLLSLNRPVQWYIPEFVGDGKQAVMVHHLLTHTSGLKQKDVNVQSATNKGSVEIPPSEDTQHPAINEELFLGYDAPLSSVKNSDAWRSPASALCWS